MSALTDAFADLLDAQEEACGERLTATIGAVTNKDAIVEEVTFDEILAAGGTGENGGFRLQMKKSDFATRPAKFASATAKGVTLEVLQISESHGIYTFTIGDPVKDE